MMEAPIEKLGALLQHCEAVARRMLTEAGEFYPVAAFISPDGKVQALAADIGKQRPDPKELYQFLHGTIGQMKADGHLVGFALASNAKNPARV